MLRKSHLLGLIVVLPLLVVLGALLIVGRRTPSPTQALNEYVAAGYLTETDNHLVWNIAQGFAQGTRFEDKVVINAPPQADSINIYVLREDPKQYLRGIECNCAYLGQDNIIVCDTELLEYFRRLLEEEVWEEEPTWLDETLGKAEALEAIALYNSRFSFFLLQWIIGHEIGHLVLDHGVGQYYFQPPSWFPVQGREHQPAIARQNEQEADRFVVEYLSQEGDQLWGWLTLSSVIATLHSQVSTDQETTTIELTDDSDIHPPWLIRALDMATLLIETEGVVDETGYFDTIRENIRLVPDGPPPFTLCGAKVAPVIDLAAFELEEPIVDDYYLDIQQGFDFWRLAEYDQAITNFTAGINLMVALIVAGHEPPPQLLEAYLQRGVIYFIQGNYETAIANWEAAAKVQPDDGRAYNNLGFAYYELDQLDEAIAQWQIAVTKDPLLDDGWAGLGIAFYAKRQTEDAIVAYQNALAIEPNYASLEWLRYERSWTEKSLRDAEALLSLIEP